MAKKMYFVLIQRFFNRFQTKNAWLKEQSLNKQPKKEMDLQSKHLRRIKWLDKFYDKHEHRLANESYDFSYDVL